MGNHFNKKNPPFGLVVAAFLGICMITTAPTQVQPKTSASTQFNKPQRQQEQKVPGPTKNRNVDLNETEKSESPLPHWNRKVDPDVGLLVKHLLERHLAGYPGDKSKVEEPQV